MRAMSTKLSMSKQQEIDNLFHECFDDVFCNEMFSTKRSNTFKSKLFFIFLFPYCEHYAPSEISHHRVDQRLTGLCSTELSLLSSSNLAE